jgi:hypothetical protein
MDSFSVRQGLKPRQVIQIDSMNIALRNGLWDALTISYWNEYSPYIYSELNPYGNYSEGSGQFINYRLILDIWIDFFNHRLEEMPNDTSSFVFILRKWFFNESDTLWNDVYDFVEFLAANDADKQRSDKFRDECNKVLEKRLSGYRFIGERIAPIISDVEIKEIEKALSYEGNLQAVSKHIERAIKSMSNRENPDFPNSIAESMKALGAVCKKIAGKEDDTLGNAFQATNKKLGLDEHLFAGIRSIYKYTCEAGGIRYPEKDSNVPPELEDAQFMLVICSGIVNYLTEKARKTGIEL